jgi:predicted RNase H-like HicB family nuclease
MKFRAVIKQTDGWWIGWLVDLPGVNAQEETKEELLESLKVGAQEMLEAEIPFEPGFMMEAIDIPEPEWA